MPDTLATPFVSVIIPAFNDLERLGQCLDALSRQTWPASHFEIIVSDNGSDPPLAPSLAKWPGVQAVWEAEPGSYAARNAAIAVAKGKIYAFTDSDCIPEPDWIEQGVGALNSDDAPGFVGGRVEVFAEDPARPNIVEQYEMLCAFDQVRYLRLGFSVTANLFVSASVFDEVGSFDPRLRSNGDRDWGERASERGHRGVYCEDAVVAHPARRTLRELHRKATRVVGGRRARGKPRMLARELKNSFLPRLNRMIRVFKRGRGFGMQQRLGMAGVRMLVEYFRAWEGMRLRLGGAPRR